MKSSARYAKLWYAYVVIYMTYFALQEIIPVRNFLQMHMEFVYTLVGVFGAGLLVVDFLSKRRMFQIQGADILVLFFIASLLSVLVNYRYDLMGNVKSLMWMAVQILLLGALDPETPKETHVRRLCVVFDVFIVLWLLGVLWALGQYLVQFGGTMETVRMDMVKSLKIGVMGGRLYGMFEDPNYAVISSELAIGFAVFCIRWGGRPKAMRLYYGVTIALQVCYMVLSGSRMGMLAAMITAFFGVAFVTAAKINRHTAIKAASCLLAGTLGAALVFGGYKALQTGLSYAPSLIEGAQHLPGDSEDGKTDRVDFSRDDLDQNSDYSNNRFKIWADYLTVLKATPVFGTSPRGYLPYAEEHFGDMFVVQRHYSTHNGYLLLFLSVGVLGGGIMLVWIIRILVLIMGYLVRRWQSRDDTYWMVFLFTLLLLTTAVSAMTGQGIFFCNLIQDILFWLVMGVTLYLIRQSEPERTKPSFVGRLCDQAAARLRPAKRPGRDGGDKQP